jgi:hypothetical protein
MYENYGQNHIRAQARANILGGLSAGWIVDRVDGCYVVRHDGKARQIEPDRRAAVCVEPVSRYRNRLVVKAI